MDEIEQKKKMLLEVVLVITFFILVLCGVIYAFQKIFESKPVQSTITFIQNETLLFKQYWDNTETSITNTIDETQYSLSEKAPWLNLKKRPLPSPEPTIENSSSEAEPQSENQIINPSNKN